MYQHIFGKYLVALWVRSVIYEIIYFDQWIMRSPTIQIKIKNSRHFYFKFNYDEHRKKLLVEIKPDVFYGSNPSFDQLFDPAAERCLVMMGKELKTPIANLIKINEAPQLYSSGGVRRCVVSLQEYIRRRDACNRSKWV